MNVCPTCREAFGSHVRVCPRDGSLLQPARATDDLWVGRVLSGRYRIRERLGSGGFGTVYKVTDTHLEDVEALKLFNRERFDPREATEAIERFEREAKLLRRLGKRTPHIVSVTNFVKDDAEGLFYFTMEYVEGDNLAQLLAREGPLELWRAVGIVRQLCRALAVAHSNDPPVVHRDLKLENLMVMRDGGDEILKVLDFGIAKIIGQGSLTSLRLGPGTPGYAAPEQVDRPNLVDYRADLFAMGVVLFGMLTAREPWTGGVVTEPTSDAWSLLRAAKEEDPIPLRRVRSEMPEPLEAIVCKLLEKRPEDRFQSSAEVIQALDALEALYRDFGLAGRGSPLRLRPRPMPLSERPEGPTTVGIRIQGLPDRLKAGDRVPLHASMRSIDGLEEDAVDVEWESTDPMVVRVDPATGEIEALAPGSASVTARGSGISSSVGVQVVAPPAMEVVEETPGSVGDGAGATPAAGTESVPRPSTSARPPPRPVRVRAPAGITLPGRLRVVWLGIPLVAVMAALWMASRSSSTATPVLSPAEVRITNADGLPPPEEGWQIAEGEELLLAAVSLDTSGATLDRLLTWTSSDEEVARVDSSGRVVGAGAGEARVSASVDGLSRDVPVTVIHRVATLSIVRAGNGATVGEELELVEGATSSLRAIARSGTGVTIDRTTSWTSVNPLVAAVDAQGRVTGRAPGATRLQARVDGVARDLRVVVAPSDAVASRVAGPAEPVRAAAPPPAAPGVLQLLITNTWAEIWVDGQLQGETDRLPGLQLAAGPHTLRLLRAGMLSWDTTVVLAGGDTIRVRTMMRPREDP